MRQLLVSVIAVGVGIKLMLVYQAMHVAAGHTGFFCHIGYVAMMLLKQ